MNDFTNEKDIIEQKFKEKEYIEFNTKTPKNNIIKGKLLMSRDSHHGSLLIEEVNGHITKQVIRGFPKIKYYNTHTHMSMNKIIRGYEKLDGTCIGIYKLRNHKDEIIEHVPKTRQKAVADPLFQEMLQKCDLRLVLHPQQIYDIVFFELFGMLNQHTISHMNTNIDVRLIGASLHGSMVHPLALYSLSEKIQIPLPKSLVRLSKNEMCYENKPWNIHIQFENSLFPEFATSCDTDSWEHAIEIVEDYLEHCNSKYMEEKTVLKYEGVVFYNEIKGDSLYHTQYIKAKPRSIRAKLRIPELPVSIFEIRKEIQKIMSENHHEFMEKYDEKETINMIKEALLEEYSESDVNHPKVTKVIKKELHNYINTFTNSNLNAIVDGIISEFDGVDVDINDMMRFFAINYPLQKHKSSDVYFILSKRLDVK